MRKQSTFHIAITDTFGGEANYTWKREYRIKASSPRGAITQLAKSQGAGWRKVYGDFDTSRYDLDGACVCAFVSYVDSGESIFNDVPFLTM